MFFKSKNRRETEKENVDYFAYLILRSSTTYHSNMEQCPRRSMNINFIPMSDF